jgi:probable rRNA maturation factor
MPDDPSSLLYRPTRAGLERRRVRDFAERIRTEVAGGRSFTCLIANDRELQRLNLQFLGKDSATDVLSFPSADEGGCLGEIAISADRAAEQSREFGHTLEQEIGILMLHGVLHLLGMDHQRDRGRMARAEKRWRTLLGLPCGLIERVRR